MQDSERLFTPKKTLGKPHNPIQATQEVDSLQTEEFAKAFLRLPRAIVNEFMRFFDAPTRCEEFEQDRPDQKSTGHNSE